MAPLFRVLEIQLNRGWRSEEETFPGKIKIYFFVPSQAVPDREYTVTLVIEKNVLTQAVLDTRLNASPWEGLKDELIDLFADKIDLLYYRQVHGEFGLAMQHPDPERFEAFVDAAVIAADDVYAAVARAKDAITGRLG